MGSDLERFRDHARKMAGAKHKPECWSVRSAPVGLSVIPTPCRGCVTADDRALWVRLADEVDAWLTRDVEAWLASDQDQPMLGDS